MSCTTNIICLLWKGQFRGRDYTDQDVWRLYHIVQRHMDRDFTFYTLTNDMMANTPGQKIELLHNWPGWWGKVELFRPDMPCGRTMYLDLDTYVLQNLQPLLDTPGDLVMFPSPYEAGKYQAGTMLFTPAAYHWVYNRFRKNPEHYMRQYRSEQDIYADWLPGLPTFPKEWMIKLSVLRRTRPTDETIIVTGRPKGEDFRNPTFANYLNDQSCM